MLDIQLESIGEFVITNPDIPPDVIGEKFCRLDINMKVDGRRVDLEVQVLSENSDKTCNPRSFIIRVYFVKSYITRT